MFQNELEQLSKKFKENEKNSLDIDTIPKNKYLCIRMDGFKATKKHLKDTLINKHFNYSLYKSNQMLFNSFKHYLTNEYASSIICTFIVNDEISIILGKDNNHKDSRKIMKLCTLFASTLSSATTLTLNKTKKQIGTIAFDARPILLERSEINEYIRYRYLIAKRYAYWKVLRLNNIDNWKENYIFKNIDNCINLTKEHHLENEALQIIDTYKFYLPNKETNPQLNCLKVNKNNMEIQNIDNKIHSYITYLNNSKI